MESYSDSRFCRFLFGPNPLWAWVCSALDRQAIERYNRSQELLREGNWSGFGDELRRLEVVNAEALRWLIVEAPCKTSLLVLQGAYRFGVIA